MMTHLLFFGSNTAIKRWDSVTGAWTNLAWPRPWTYTRPYCFSGRSDDLWVGLNNSLGYPWVHHYDGSTWTLHTLTAAGTASSYGTVGAILWVSHTEVYCVANKYTGSSTALLMKWDGATWSVLGTTGSYGVNCSLHRDSLGRIFVAGDSTSAGGWRYWMWDGSTLQALSDGEDSAFANVTGRGLEIWFSHGNGIMRVGSPEAGWSTAFNDPNVFARQSLALSASYLWTYSTSCNVNRRDFPSLGNLATEASGASASYPMLAVLGDGDYVFVGHDSGLRRKVGLGGAWSTIILGSGANALWGYTVDDLPPKLRNTSPGLGETASPDCSMYFEVYDEETGVDLSTVEVEVNGFQVYADSLQKNGWMVVVTALTDGYSFLCTPPSVLLGALVLVDVHADDIAGNTMDRSYAFFLTTEDEQVDDDTDYMDLYLTTDGHDLAVENYDLKLVAGVDAVRQRQAVALRLFLGEWFLEEDAGMPYYRDVFIANPKSRVIEALFRREILADPQIERVTEFAMSINKATRKVSVDYEAVSSVGVIEASDVFP